MDSFYAWLTDLATRGILPSAFRYPFVSRGVLAMLVLAPLLGGMSHVVVARRLAFFSAALGQAALTGLTLGIALGEPIASPWGGIFGFCMLSAIGMVYVKRRSRLPPDTLVGVFMALTLGLGICLLVVATRQFNVHQIEAVMFGSLLTVTDFDLLLLVGVAFVVLVILAFHYNAILSDSLSPQLAHTAGVDTTFVDYLFVVLLTAAIVVSLKIVGALLVEALVVVPAAAAKNVARTSPSYLAISIATALVAGIGGILVSSRWAVPTGGAVVLALAVAFFVTLALSAVRGQTAASDR